MQVTLRKLKSTRRRKTTRRKVKMKMNFMPIKSVRKPFFLLLTVAIMAVRQSKHEKGTTKRSNKTSRI